MFFSDSEEIHQSNSDKQNNFLNNNERKTLMKNKSIQIKGHKQQTFESN